MQIKVGCLFLQIRLIDRVIAITYQYVKFKAKKMSHPIRNDSYLYWNKILFYSAAAAINVLRSSFCTTAFKDSKR